MHLNKRALKKKLKSNMTIQLLDCIELGKGAKYFHRIYNLCNALVYNLWFT